MPVIRTIFMSLAVALLLSGCGDATLRDSLSQEQANEVVAALVERGIRAEVTRESGKGKYRVGVKRGNYSEAVTILNQLRLPSEPRSSFSDLIASRGLMPDPRELEALRLDRALAAELEEALESIPAVAQARAVIRLNSVQNSADTGKGAAVLITRKPGAELREEDLRPILDRSLPGLDPSQIVVQFYESGTTDPVGGVSQGVERTSVGGIRKVPLTEFLWIWRVPEDEYNSLAGWLMLGIIGVFVLGLSVGSLLTSARMNPRDGGAPARGTGPKGLPSKSMAQRKELPETPKEGGGL